MEFREGSVNISKRASNSFFDVCNMGKTRQHSFGPEDKNKKHFVEEIYTCDLSLYDIKN